MADALGSFGTGFNFGKGVVDEAEAGVRRSRLSDLASQAYGATGQNRDALVQQAGLNFQ